MIRGVLLVLSVMTGGALAETDPRQPYSAVRCDDFSLDRTLLVLPVADGVIAEKDVTRLDDATSDVHIRAVKNRKKLIAGEVNGAWCVSEKTLKIGKRSIDLIISATGGLSGHGSDRLEDRATVIGRAFTNKEAARLAKANKLKRPAALTGEDSDGDAVLQLRAAIGDRAKLASLWSTRGDVLLAGSARGEIYEGALARAMFAAWNLAFRIDGPVSWSTTAGDLTWVLANVETLPTKGAPPIMYRAFFVLLADHPGDDREHDTWRLVLAHFALVE